MINKIFIIAGEDSGDNFGGKLIASLKEKYPQAEFKGIGGKEMRKQGLKSIAPMEQLSIMGFVEVIPRIPALLGLIKKTAEIIENWEAQLVITIDSPGFNKRLAQKIQRLRNHCKLIHIVAPSVWAYRPQRAKKMAILYDLLGCFLPFEPPYFTKEGLDARFIGHPALEYDYSPRYSLENFLSKNQIDPKKQKVLLAMPGSRANEIKKLWPIYLQTFNKLKQHYTNLIVLVPLNKHLLDKLPLNNFDNNFIKTMDNKYRNNCFQIAEFGLIKSGTSSLEVAINNIPMVVCYKVNKVSEFLFRLMSKIKNISLINILANERIISELVQKNCTAEKLVSNLIEIDNNNLMLIEQYQQQIDKLKYKNKNPSQYMAEIISQKFDYQF